MASPRTIPLKAACKISLVLGNDALAYAHWAGCQLPTEAQWEKAACGPRGLSFPWGNAWDATRVRYHGSRGSRGSDTTCPVSGYPLGVSGYLTYNPSGNVEEWCADWHALDPDAPPIPVDWDGETDADDADSPAGEIYQWWEDQSEPTGPPRPPPLDPQGPNQGATRVARGGSWNNLSPEYLRCSNRCDYHPRVCRGYLGFRLVKPAAGSRRR